MRKSVFITGIIIAVLSFTACSAKTPSTPQTPQSSTPAASAAPTAKAAEASETKGLTEPIAEQPALLVSVGQSADVEMVKNMMERNGLNFSTKSLATEEDLGDNKTLVLAVGGSSKGLGAAGINADDEIARVKKLIDAAKEKGFIIIAVHIGGEARRGELSDKFIGPCFEKADYAIVVKEGDKDGLMEGLAKEANIPIDLVAGMADAIPKLKECFK